MEKNSFVLFKEQKEIVDKLSDEDAGKLFKAIFEYVDNGEVPKLTQLLDIVIIPFKQSIDRNSEKWEQIKEKRSLAGKASAEKRASKNKQNPTNPTNVNSVKQTSTNVNKSQQSSTDSTVSVSVSDSVSVSVSDSVSVSVNNKEKNIKKEKHKYGRFGRVKLTDDEYFRLANEFGEEFIKNQIELLDEYVESNNNKNKYTNFNLVLRKSIRENWFNKNKKETQQKKEADVPKWFYMDLDKKEEISDERKREIEAIKNGTYKPS